ncbi:zinc dependent phospholipase C family protein [Candidatus Woesearchaeota archaeon]|nr:zinc dependent phospholipase C family protein [Candidatus Woesearchaeota archaeon]
MLGKNLWQMLNRHYSFLYLGAVSPDLPYLSFKLGQVNWADVMHYEKTNSIFLAGHNALKNSWKTKTDTEEAKFVWLMGYLSHLVTDATIHPMVKAIVGPYNEENKDNHRICEMTEDSLIYKAKFNGEIRYTEFSEMLKFDQERLPRALCRLFCQSEAPR